MKFDCGPKHIPGPSIEDWHRWFAWRPVRLSDHDCRWLEYIERKGKWHGDWDGDYWTWEYRPLANPAPDGSTTTPGTTKGAST